LDIAYAVSKVQENRNKKKNDKQTNKKKAKKDEEIIRILHILFQLIRIKLSCCDLTVNVHESQSDVTHWKIFTQNWSTIFTLALTLHKILNTKYGISSLKTITTTTTKSR
jgi:hypothetical protein